MIAHFQQLGEFREFDVNANETWGFPNDPDDSDSDDDEREVDNIDDLITDENVDDEGEPDNESTDLCDDE